MTDQPQASALVGAAAIRAVAIGAIVFLSVINYLGVIPGSRLLNVFVVLKVAALAVLIAAGLLFSGVLDARAEVAAPASGGTLAAFGAALIPIVFAYGGWQNANYVAEEIKDPKRILPICLLLGTAIVALVYVTINIAYLRRGPRRAGGDDDAGVGLGAAALWRCRRSIRDRRDRDFDVRVPEPRACLRRRASTTRWPPTARSSRKSRSCIRSTRRPRWRSCCSRHGRSR